MTLQWNFSNCTAVFPLGFHGNRPSCDHAWLCLLYFSNNFWSCWAVSPKSISNIIKLFHENRQLCRAERSCKCPKGCNMNLPLIKQWFTWLRDRINVLVIRKVSITVHYQPHYKSMGNQSSSVHFPSELLLFQRWNTCMQKGRKHWEITDVCSLQVISPVLLGGASQKCKTLCMSDFTKVGSKDKQIQDPTYLET